MLLGMAASTRTQPVNQMYLTVGNNETLIFRRIPHHGKRASSLIISSIINSGIVFLAAVSKTHLVDARETRVRREPAVAGVHVGVRLSHLATLGYYAFRFGDGTGRRGSSNKVCKVGQGRKKQRHGENTRHTRAALQYITCCGDSSIFGKDFLRAKLILPRFWGERRLYCGK